MKKLLSLILAIIICNISFAQQSGTIQYVSTIKLDLKGIEGMDLGDMLPQEMSTNKELIFNSSASIYKDSKDNVSEDIELSSDDGSFEMVIGTDDSEEIFHSDLKLKSTTFQTSFMSKEFLIKGKIERKKWKITNEKIKYLGYVCQKATLSEEIPPSSGSEEEPKEQNIVAWFTSEIPASIGPHDYYGLPGAVLMVSINEGKTEIKATNVDLTPPDSKMLEKPTKGQEVTHEEYEKIMEVKMKEMQEMYGGREGVIMIRG